MPGVYVDNERGTLAALEHLWELGHRGIICVVDERMADGPLRASVYERFMQEHGEGDRVRVYFTTQPDPGPGYRLGRDLFAHLDRPGHPTAVFAATGDWGASGGGGEARTARIDRAAAELAAMVERREPADEADPYADVTPFEQLLHGR